MVGELLIIDRSGSLEIQGSVLLLRLVLQSFFRVCVLSRCKVIVTTLDDHDRRLVAKNSNLVSTQAFAFGELEDSDIVELRAAGLIVEPLDRRDDIPGKDDEPQWSLWHYLKEVFGGGDSTVASDPQSARLPNVAFGHGNKPKSIPKISSKQTYNCLLTIKGPLIDEWRQQLERAGASVVEREAENTFIARCQAYRLDGVRALEFVASMEIFTAHMTQKRWSAKTLKADPVADDDQPKEWNIRLQSADDFNRVMKWLINEKIAITSTAKNKRKIRVRGPDPSSKIDDALHHQAIMEIEEHVDPITCNDQAHAVIGLTTNTPNFAAELLLTGKNQTVGIADTGIDHTHPDFDASRIVSLIALGRPDETSDPSGHGTHVAGTLLGSGAASNGQYRGVAPAAKLVFQSLLGSTNGLSGLPADIGELFQAAYDNGARIHNNSWGSSYGDGFEAFYRFNSRDLDEFVDQRRDMLIVVAAGNAGSAVTSNNPNLQPGFVDWSSMLTPATAKNALTVGASRGPRTEGGWSQRSWGECWNRLNVEPIGAEKISGDTEELAGFSSRGPCSGNRIKPDVVAPGTDIISVRSAQAKDSQFWGLHPDNSKYAYMGGTSMATPLVAGCAALVREYYQQMRGIDPSAALLKATLINGTKWLSGRSAAADQHMIANNHQGFGCVDMRTTLPSAPDAAMRLTFSDGWKDEKLLLRTGSTASFLFKLEGGLPLRVCLTWTDPPGPGLQNVLGLRLEHQETGRRYYGNQDTAKQAKRFDRDNNVQIIRLPDAPPGDYVISIVALNLLRPGQDFALVVLGALDQQVPPGGQLNRIS